MNTDINIRISKDTHKRIKVVASRRGKKIKQHIDDLSRLSIKIIENGQKDTNTSNLN